MGVKGLWRLLLPIGRRISIETLEGKTLAIDASIWLTQFLKAMRDPDTGSVRPAAHLIGFFRRISKLLFHGIRPVLVFDGATPEIKIREIQQRRQRREQLMLSSTENKDALQRMAKRLLLAELKKRKAAASGSGQGKASSSSGAFAPGFQPSAEDREEASSRQKTAVPTKNENSATTSVAAALKESENVIDIEEWEEPEQQQLEMENDWDKAVVEIPSSEDDDDDKEEHLRHPIAKENEDVFDIDYISSLSAHDRKDAIEEAQRKQRMRSRREFMPVAAQPEAYSQTQLRNFLRSTRLNQQIQKTSVKVAGTEDPSLGERMASDATRRIFFVKDNPPNDSSNKAAVAQGSSQWRSTTNRQHETAASLPKKGWDDEEYEWQDENIISIENDQGDSSKVHGALSMDVVQVDNGSSDDEDEGEFLVAKKLEARKTRDAPPPAKESLMTELVHVDDDSSEDGGGGFLVEKMSTVVRHAEVAHTNGKTAPVELEQDDDDSNDGRGGGFLVEKTSADAQYAQELEDELLARGLQDSELENVSDTIIRNRLMKPINKSAPRDDSTGSLLVKSDAVISEQSRAGEATKQSQNLSSTEKSVASPTEPDLTLTSDNDESEDDVDWEDGDEACELEPSDEAQHVHADIANDATLAAHLQAEEDALGAQNAALKMGMERTTGDDETDDDIDWEDGNDVNEEHQLKNMAEQGAVGGTMVQPLKVTMLSNSQKERQLLNEEDATTAALEHAQETAANLTDWAGRAFRRAVAKHVEETRGAIPIDRSPSKEEKHTVDGVGFSPTCCTPDAQHVAKISPTVKESSVTVESLKPSASNEKQAVALNSGVVEPTIAVKNDASDAIHAHVPAPMDLLESLQEQDESLREEMNRQERDMDTITDEMKEEVIRLIRLFGVPYIEAPAEAEAQCAALEELGLVDGVVTEDSDVFVFGGKNVYRNIFDDQKYVEAYFTKDAEKDLALGRNEFVALAMLLGGDYTEGVKGVGIVNGMEILQAFDMSNDVKDGLTKFRKWLDGFDPADAGGKSSEGEKLSSAEQLFHKNHRSTRTRWTAPEHFPANNVLNAYMNPVVEKSRERFSWGTPDLDNLLPFCHRNMGWDSKETERLILPVVEKVESGSRQTRIESFFMSYEDNIKFAKVKSKRLRSVFEGIQNPNGDEEPNENTSGRSNGDKDDRTDAASEKLSEEKRKKRKKSTGRTGRLGPK